MRSIYLTRLNSFWIVFWRNLSIGLSMLWRICIIFLMRYTCGRVYLYFRVHTLFLTRLVSKLKNDYQLCFDEIFWQIFTCQYPCLQINILILKSWFKTRFTDIFINNFTNFLALQHLNMYDALLIIFENYYAYAS